jgi:glycerol-3-phosphate dehydrogenase
MITINRNPENFSKKKYDLIVVGGGIYGVMLLLEASRRNLSALLLEQNDFGSQTSLNHLRTLHGGLRYLQSLDFWRFKESVAERKWFLQYFPQFVKVMPCLMPLYKRGLQRKSIFRIAFLINDILSFSRNRGVLPSRHIPKCKIIKPEEVKKLFPLVKSDGLESGAIWYDASVEEYQRLFMKLLKLSIVKGSSVLNYMQAEDLLLQNGLVSGVRAVDTETGSQYEFNAPLVINATGPWSRDTAAFFDQDFPRLFKKRLLGRNILFDREALSTHSLGLSIDKKMSQTYFFHPWKNRLLIGTGEMIVEKNRKECQISTAEMEKIIKNINEIVPGIKLSEKDVLRAYTGILPATEKEILAKREILIDHSRKNGPKGLFSISGVKFTTSRLVADKTLQQLFPDLAKISYRHFIKPQKEEIRFEYNWHPRHNGDLNVLKDIVKNESVIHLSDLILRRTSLGDNPERAIAILPKLKKMFSWDNKKWDQEVANLRIELRKRYPGQHSKENKKVEKLLKL